MSTGTTPPTPPASLIPTPPAADGPRQLKIVSHSNIFYWWPIWVLGYACAIWTAAENHRLAVVPADAKVYETKEGDKTVSYQVQFGHPTRVVDRAVAAQAKGDATPFGTSVSAQSWLGPVYCTVLLLTILITNVPMRGLWSFIVILLVLLVVLMISMVKGGWENVGAALGGLHIYINMAGYLFIATAVLVLWAVSVWFFDERTYMIVSPGQISVCEYIGASVKNFDTTGLQFEKQRDDIFRHWILGFGSGDLIVKTYGAEKHEIRLPNVLNITRRLTVINDILREREVVTSGSARS